MSKVRINILARELEVKSQKILDMLAELGLATGKTHSSSLEDYETDKVRAHFVHGSRSAGQAGTQSSRTSQVIAPKIDLSHISKTGDVMKAILAKKQEQEAAARPHHAPAPPPAAPPVAAARVVTVAQPAAAPERPPGGLRRFRRHVQPAPINADAFD